MLTGDALRRPDYKELGAVRVRLRRPHHTGMSALRYT